MPARFFHGSLADLPPGTALLPGERIGLSHHGRSGHVYATTTDFRPDWLDDGDEPGFANSWEAFDTALDTAAEWAGFAADLRCRDASCGGWTDRGPDHRVAVRDGLWPGCVRVYEIAPAGPVEPDGSGDLGPEGVRMAAATVVHRVDAAGRRWDQTRVLVSS